MNSDLKKAITVARKRIPTLRDRALNQNLSYFCGSYAEAFRQGVSEAQTEIVSRLRYLEKQSRTASEIGDVDG